MNANESPEVVDRVAQVIFEEVEPGLMWGDPPSEAHRDLYREVAKAAIRVMAADDRG